MPDYKAGIFTLGSQGESKENSQSSNKIKFSKPVVLPLRLYTNENVS